MLSGTRLILTSHRSSPSIQQIVLEAFDPRQVLNGAQA
jgi:hypothetical protein